MGPIAEGVSIVTVGKLVHGGWGLVRRNEQVCLVRGVIPGEVISVRDGTRRRGVQEVTVEGIVKPSPNRVAPPCPVYHMCGGCQLQHIQYDTQLRLKREILVETLARLGKVQVAVEPVIPACDPYGYRSLVRFVVFRGKAGFALGFHQAGSQAAVEASGCLLVPQAMREVLAVIQERLARLGKPPCRIVSLEVRRSVAFGSVLLSWRTGPATPAQARSWLEAYADVPAVTGQVLTAAHRGRWVDRQDWIVDRLDGLRFRITDGSFMQANWLLAERLSRTVAAWVAPSAGLRVLELYAGIGVLGLPLARRGALVTAVEANRWALADARYAAKMNHVGRCRFRHAKAEAFLASTAPGAYDVVLMNPPRVGLSEEALSGILTVNAPRLIYLSCDPATLARDLGRLCTGGYRVTRVQPFDLFPQTAHLETLVELVR